MQVTMQIRPTVVFFTLVLMGCAEADKGVYQPRKALDSRWHAQRMVVVPRPPIIAAETPEDVTLARRVAERARSDSLIKADDARRITVDALPYLAGSEAGQRFLRHGGPRALARGMPALSCPATGLATEPSSTPRGRLAALALERCLAALAPEHTDCGCRVIAINDVLTIPREDAAYATGVTARIRAPAIGLDGVLVAEAEGEDRVLLRDLNGPVAQIRRRPGERVVVTFEASGARYAGRAIKEGYRRGRIAERIYASDREGNRLSLLIGFPPDELAQRAGAWLAWPAGG